MNYKEIKEYINERIADKYEQISEAQKYNDEDKIRLYKEALIVLNNLWLDCVQKQLANE